MAQRASDILQLIKPRKIIIPIIIGLAAVSILFFRNFNRHAFDTINWTWTSSIWMLLALLMVVVRDLAYMVRIRALTHNFLSWKQAFEDIMCWEFASAVAPGAIGGGFAFAIFVINKEGVKLGKTVAVVLFSSFLDGLFFAIMAPIVYFTIGKAGLFSNLDSTVLQQITHGKELYYSFWTIYFVVLSYKVVVGYALFVNAGAVKTLLTKIFSIKGLRRWKAAEKTGDEMILASEELKKENLAYWIKSFIPTFISWTARFVIINCIIAAFSSVDINHYVMYGRQVVIGVLMMGTPTPGGTGLAEYMFSVFLGEFINNAALTVSLAFLWRLISYYPYLIMGAIIIPRWVKRVYSYKHNPALLTLNKDK